MSQKERCAARRKQREVLLHTAALRSEPRPALTKSSAAKSSSRPGAISRDLRAPSPLYAKYRSIHANRNGSESAPFNWSDPFLLTEQLTDVERAICDATRNFARHTRLPDVTSAYLNESTDTTIFQKMGERGLLGVTIPSVYGGVNAGYVAYGLIAREIERVDSGYRSMMSVQSSLVMYPIFAYGSEQQRQRYLPNLARGEIDRLFRTDGTGRRLGPCEHADTSREDRRGLSADGRQDLDLEQPYRGRVRRVGQIRSA